MQLKQAANAAAKDGDSEPSTAKPEALKPPAAQKEKLESAKASATAVASREFAAFAAKPKEKPAKAKAEADCGTKPSVPMVRVWHRCKSSSTAVACFNLGCQQPDWRDMSKLRKACTTYGRSCESCVSVPKWR